MIVKKTQTEENRERREREDKKDFPRWVRKTQKFIAQGRELHLT